MGKRSIKRLEDGLTDLQKRFALEYVVDYSLQNAAIRSGCAKKHAKVAGYKMMQIPAVIAYVEKIKLEIGRQVRLEAYEVIAHLCHAIRRNPKHFVNEDGTTKNINELSDEDASCINGFDQEVFYNEDGTVSNVKTKLRLIPKETALDMGLKHKGLFAAVMSEHKVTLDLAALCKRPEGEPDEVESRIVETTAKRIEE